MPWQETTLMTERMMFVAEYLKGETTMVDLCQLFGVSRKTGYKWVQRFQADGVEGL
jgi:transposase-like protein